jgi:hypothetical protein
MRSGPSKTAEAIVGAFLPPACREEVLGDLYERYRSAGQYAWDAVRTIPLVVISRIRRTADPQMLLMQAFVLYTSFLGAAWLSNRAFLNEQSGLLRLAIPAAMSIFGLVLEDACAKPGRRSPYSLVRGPVLGVGLALASQGIFRVSNSDLAVPKWIMLDGCAMSLVLSSALRILFPPVTRQLQGANVPAQWPKQSGEALGNPVTSVQIVKGIAVVVLLVLWSVYLVWKRN